MAKLTGFYVIQDFMHAQNSSRKFYKSSHHEETDSVPMNNESRFSENDILVDIFNIAYC